MRSGPTLQLCILQFRPIKVTALEDGVCSSTWRAVPPFHRPVSVEAAANLDIGCLWFKGQLRQNRSLNLRSVTRQETIRFRARGF
jgi:hypothetical protein